MAKFPQNQLDWNSFYRNAGNNRGT